MHLSIPLLSPPNTYLIASSLLCQNASKSLEFPTSFFFFTEFLFFAVFFFKNGTTYVVYGLYPSKYSPEVPQRAGKWQGNSPKLFPNQFVMGPTHLGHWYIYLMCPCTSNILCRWQQSTPFTAMSQVWTLFGRGRKKKPGTYDAVCGLCGR